MMVLFFCYIFVDSI